MRKLLLLITGGLLLTAGAEKIGAAVSPPGNSTADEAILTFMSRGREHRSNATNLTAFLEIAALPQSDQVVTGLVGKVSALLVRSNISSNLVAGIGIPALTSALDATVQFDSIGEFRRSGAGQLTGSVAWRTSTEQDAQLIRRLNSDNAMLHLARKGNWTTLELGADSTTVEKLIRRAESFEVSTNWLDLTANLKEIGMEWLTPNGSASNKLHCTIAPRGDGFHTEIHLTSDRPYEIEMAPWNVPTNTIRSPLIGFTAVQGIGHWIQKQSMSRTIGLDDTANEAFFWSQPLSAFSVSAALHVERPQAMVNAVAKDLLPSLSPNVAPLRLGSFEMHTNETMLLWRNLPIAIPFLRPALDSNFVFGGLFPLTNPSKKPAPPELIAQVTSHTNLLYYDWEITGERLDQWRQISQFIAIIRNQFSGNTNLISERWLKDLEPKLGNCITEITLVHPNELSLVRRSAVGVSSFELAVLAHWLDPAYEKPKGKKTRLHPVHLPKP